jgi:hypothetical protein
LRHSHGRHLLAAGVPLPAVPERLGHSLMTVTSGVYSHALCGRDDEAACLCLVVCAYAGERYSNFLFAD